MELDPEYDTCLFRAIQVVYERYRRDDKRPEFVSYINDVMVKFR